MTVRLLVRASINTAPNAAPTMVPMPPEGAQQLSWICSRSMPPAVLMMATVDGESDSKGSVFCR